jgi:hypothetical protein
MGKKDNREEIPSYICWEVWKHKNIIIFENDFPSLGRVCSCILQVLGEYKLVQKLKKLRIDRPPCLDLDLVVGFFDGASQDLGKKCGARDVLKCLVLGTYQIKMNCGSGKNTKGELLTLWCILCFENVLKVTRLFLEGDSKIIIDWFNNDNNLQVLSLQPWMEKIRRLSGSFLQLKEHHIYITYKKVVDKMCKEALQMYEEGVF